MALQTNTFTWGSFAYQSASNSYVIELTLTENSTNTASNTSSVDYVLKLKSGAQNRFTGDIKATLTLAGTAVATKTNRITAAYNSTWTLLSGTATVGHNADGSLTMPIKVSVETYNSYAPPSGSFGWSWALTTIPRASAITSAANVTLGNACSVKWTPASAAFRYKLNFSLGSWSYTTGAIHPNKTTAYTYTGYTLPLEVAKQLTAAKTGTMTAVLTTYSDSSCSNAIDTDTKTFTITVPDNTSTRPTVTLTLSPDPTPFSGLYIQGLSRVKATVTATGKYGAAIKKKTFTVNGSTYEGSLSAYLTTAKALTVTAQAADARGITGTATKSITVLPYSKPKLEGVKAYRCNAAGEQDDSGQYLNIEATRSYAPVKSGSTQKNFCRIEYRYKQENGSYSDYTTILADTASGNSVVTGALLEGALQRKLSYVVQIRAIDTAGNWAVVTLHIPSESIFCHKPPGGKALGLGGYAQGDDRLEVWWDQRNRGDLTVDGAINGICESPDYPGCRYRTVSGKTEWLEPPMVLGQEYRTTRRLDGKPVYVKTVKVVSLPNSNAVLIDLNTTIGDVIQLEAIATTPSDNQVPFPIFTSAGQFRALAYVRRNSAQIYIITTDDLTAYSARFTLYYTK